MNRPSRPKMLEIQQPPSSLPTRPRSQSSSSTDYSLPSNASTVSLAINSLINISPEPAYIASSAAARLVTSDHENFFRSHHDNGAVGPDTPTMFVNNGSLALVNQFLDFLLYSFLSKAKSTSLSALRPAITEVLRVRLAKEAVAGADQELKSYLGSDDEDIGSFDGTLIEPNKDRWNFEITWRKCRVQCMVYSSLGDLEEDDEAFYPDNGLEGVVGFEQYLRQSNNPGIISPAVAIWLTSILEFVGEQILLVAGHATIARHSMEPIMPASSSFSNASPEATFPDKLIVDVSDTEKVALNPSLGRIWREWRKKVRSSSGGGGGDDVGGRQRSFSASSREGVLQRLDRQPSLQRDASSDEFPTSAAFTAHGEHGEPSARGEGRAVGQVKVTPLVDGSLAPIVETETPQISDASKIFVLQDSHDSNGSFILRRPQSLIVLPWTNSSPFVLTSAIKRPMSLPDLKRGDFADPNTEDGEIDILLGDQGSFTTNGDQLYMSIPLPEPGSNEENELKEFSAQRPSANDQQESMGNIRPPDVMCRVGSDPITPIESTELAVIQSSVDDRSNDPELLSEISLEGSEPSDKAEIPSPPREALSLRRIEEDEYDPYAIKQTLPNIPPRVEPFVSYDDSSDSIEHVSSTSTDPETPHMKYAPSSSSGNSLIDRKIGQFHVAQSSSSTYSNTSERGTSVRVFTPPATPDKSRRSSSFSKAQRPIHTSGSTSSQASILKSFIPWPHDGSKHTKAHESDGESRSSHHSDRLAIIDDKERSFEELISSGGTIHCTITPDPIRSMEKARDLPTQKTPTSDLADFIRSTGPDGRPVTSASKTVPSSPRLPRPPPSNAPRGIPSNDNAAPLSEFMRNITPLGSPGYVVSNHNMASNSKLQRPTTSDLNPILSITPVPGGGGVPVSPGLGGGLPAVMRQTRSNSPLTSSRPLNRLLAREASGSARSDTTSALADFFRNTTPPAIGEQPVHRISRTVAPFRNTMDSAQFDHTTDAGFAEEIVLLEPTNKAPSIISAPHESYSSSFNSSTALLRSNSKKAPEYGSISTTNTVPEFKRKQVRIKDPYAIPIDGLDDDDDDMEDLEGLNLVLPKKRVEEESLADFLRNTPPPPFTPPQPLQTNLKSVQKKTSSASLMSRFGRSGRKNSTASNTDKSFPFPQSGPPAKHVTLKIPSESEGSLRLSSSGSDQYSHPSHTQARGDINNQFGFGGVIAGRNPMRSNTQARGARSARNDTDSLADFLKHTGPPPDARVTPSQKEEGRSLLQKISFSRNKKVGVA